MDDDGAALSEGCPQTSGPFRAQMSFLVLGSDAALPDNLTGLHHRTETRASTLQSSVTHLKISDSVSMFNVSCVTKLMSKTGLEI